MSAAQTKATEAKVGGEEVAALKKKIKELETQSASQMDQLEKSRGVVKNLKTLGRNLREKSEKAQKEVDTLTKELSTTKEALAKHETELAAKSEELLTVQSLVESLQPEETAQLIEAKQELLVKVQEVEKKSVEEREKFKKVLETAKKKIKGLQEALSANDDKALLEKKMKELEELSKTVEQAKMEKERMKSALESTITAIRNENLTMKLALNDLKEEKEKQQEQIEQLQQELLATQTSSKPVAVAGVVHQQEARKQPQPQAHIQPHRHQPRDEHRPTQTASIRPMTQRAATQAVVLPTSQVSSGQPEIATVQPTVSVSPSVSSAPQVPSTSQLDPTAPEFTPGDRSSSSTETMEMADESSRVSVSIRMDAVQASTSSPSVSVHGAQTSTSGNTVTTASVHPTLKRTRETVEIEFAAGDEGVAGPSGVQKKARTISAAEELLTINQDLNIGDETEGLSQDMESENEEAEVETSSQLGAVSSEIVSSDPGAGNSVQESYLQEEEGLEPFSVEAEGDMEEGEISEEGEEEESAAQEIDVLAEDEADIDQEDGETETAAPDNPELFDEDRDDEQVGDDDPDVEDDQGIEEEQVVEEEQQVVEEEQVVEEDITGENSSEPSSSSGAAVPQRSQQLPPQQAAPGYEQDPVEDSVVPSTPKLAEPRRPDGFSEAVSSPQVSCCKTVEIQSELSLHNGSTVNIR